MAGSGDRAELERRLHSYRDVNQWWPLNYTKTFVDDRSDLSHLTESVGLSGRYYTQLAEKSPRLIAGRGCGTAGTLKNTGFSAQEARAIAANVIHYGRPSIRGGHPFQWVNFSLHQESTQEIIFRSTARGDGYFPHLFREQRSVHQRFGGPTRRGRMAAAATAAPSASLVATGVDAAAVPLLREPRGPKPQVAFVRFRPEAEARCPAAAPSRGPCESWDCGCVPPCGTERRRLARRP